MKYIVCICMRARTFITCSFIRCSYTDSRLSVFPHYNCSLSLSLCLLSALFFSNANVYILLSWCYFCLCCSQFSTSKQFYSVTVTAWVLALVLGCGYLRKLPNNSKQDSGQRHNVCVNCIALEEPKTGSKRGPI